LRGYDKMTWKERAAYDAEYNAIRDEFAEKFTEDAYVEWARAREELQSRWFERPNNFDEGKARAKWPWAYRYYLDKV
jgi:hypothetical protein